VPGYLLDWARREGGDVAMVQDPAAAVKDARAVVTDCWVSMADDPGRNAAAALAPYRVTRGLMALAAPDAVFMHCLPAHRDEEVEAAVIDGPQSVVFDEAENRLHAQKAVLAWVLEG
jgi:ornithine carbamoyltransferase